ncbi:MAG: 50S ribosomal protein L25 [Candidatus Magasanikbacteria bacterium]|nr:50S ribosomal protein L25 [Candidatus Magasanikbacteria bacterium]
MSFTISATKRTAAKPEALRAEGLIPAVLYGPEITPVAVAVAYTPFVKLYQEAGEATIIDCAVEGGKSVKVLIQDVQVDPVRGKVIHVDFRQINMDKEMRATVLLRLVGESSAVKELGGTLVKPLESLNIKCLPKDLVSHIDVDLSGLKTFASIIRVADLAVPSGLTILDSGSMTVAKVTAPLTEEQLKALEAAGPQSVEDIEVEKKKKAEEGEESATAESADKPAAKEKEEKKKE